MVDGEMMADSGSGMNVNSGFGMSHFGDDTGDKRYIQDIQFMCDTVVCDGTDNRVTADNFAEACSCRITVSIRPTTGIKPLYTTIATVTMNLIVSAAIVLLNPYVTIYISYKIPPFALSVHIPDVSTSIYVEVDSKVLLGLPFCDKAFVR